MKRRVLGAFVALYTSINLLLPIFMFAPAPAEAVSSGQCIQSSTLGCVTLELTLNPAPTGNVVVTAVRQANTGRDDNFDLIATGRAGVYSSGGPIFGTNPDSAPCNDPTPAASKMFNITIRDANTNAVLGTLNSLNMCYNSNPRANNRGIKSANVAIAGQGQTKGGISGTFLVSIGGAAAQPCPGGNNNVALDSPGQTTQAPLAAGGKMNTGLTLAPGTYNVSLNCVFANNTTHFLFKGVVVRAGQITALPTATCDPLKSAGTEPGCTAAGAGPTDPTVPGSGGAAEEEPLECDAGAGFTWIICGAIKQLVGVVDAIRDNVIVPFLKEPPLDKNNPEFKTAYDIWSAFRNIASILFVLLFFLVIIGTAAGFDNYTIKKIMPHLVAGAILIPFSWYICAILIDIGNVIGQGIVSLVSAAVPPPQIDLTSNMSKVFLGAAAAGAGFVLVGAAATIGLAAIISMLIAFIVVFLTLMLRKILIITLVVLSPIAIVAWVLPNTEKWFKMWWQNLFKLIMMYPMIMMLFEAGRIFAATAGAATTQSTVTWVAPLFQVVGLIAPLFFVWKTKDWAGSGLNFGENFIGKIGGAVDKKYGQDSDFAKTRAEDSKNKSILRAKTAENAARDATTVFGRKYHSLKAGANWSRAGMGGTLPFGAKTGSESVKLKRSEAYGKAVNAKATVDAEARQSAEGDPEHPEQRVRATTQQILDKKSTERGERQGILDGFDQAGRPDASVVQRAKRIGARDNYLGSMGTAEGDIEDDNRNERERIGGTGEYVSPAMKMGAARDIAVGKAAEARGTARGVVRGGETAQAIIQAQLVASGMTPAAAAASARDIRFRNVAGAKTNDTVKAVVESQANANSNITTNAELDTKMQRDVARGGGGVISVEEARNRRLQNISASAASHTREKLAAGEGATNAHEEIAGAAGHESIDQLVEGERLGAREKLAMERKIREKRVAAQGSAAGFMDTTAALEAADIEAEDRISAGIGASRQAINQKREDERKSLVEGNANLAPTLDNKLVAAQEKSKKNTAAASAERMSLVGAVASGSAPTTQQFTDAALVGAERDLEIANAGVTGRSNTINAANAAAAEKLLNARGLTSVGAAGFAAASAAQVLAATQAGTARVRTERLSAARNVNERAAETKTQTEISGDLGGNDDLQNAINDEIIDVQRAAIASGGGPLSPAAARLQAENNLRERNLAAVGDTTRNAAATAGRAEREKFTGKKEDLESAIDARLASMPVGTTREQAEQALLSDELKAVGENTRQASGQAARTEREENLKTQDERAAAIEELRSSMPAGTTTAQAAAALRESELSNTGANAGNAAALKARTQRQDAAGQARDREQAIVAEMGGVLTRDAAAQRVFERELKNAGDNAEDDAALKARVTREDSAGRARDREQSIQEEMAASGSSRDVAERTVQERELSEAGDVSERAAAIKAREEREKISGKQENFERDIDAEIDKYALENKGAVLSRADAATQVRARGLVEAGRSARTQGAREDRKEGSKKAGVTNEVEREIDAEAQKLVDDGTFANVAAARDAAEVNVSRRNLDALGAKAKQEAGRQSRKEVKDARGTKKGLDAQIEKEAKKLRKTGMSAEDALLQATETVDTNNLNNAGEVAQIAAQTAQMRTVNDEAKVVDAYDAAVKKAPVNAARTAAASKAYKDSQDKAYNDAFAAAKASDPGMSDKDARKIAEQAQKNNEDAAIKESDKAAEKARKAAEKQVRKGRISRSEQEQAALEEIGAAAGESALRREASSQAEITAMAAAAGAPGALNAAERLTAQTEAALASKASESAAIRARYELTKPGEDLNRSYQSAESGALKAERSKILQQRVAEAATGDINYPTYEKEPVMVTDPANPSGPKIQALDEKGVPITRIKMQIDPATGKEVPVKTATTRTDRIANVDLDDDSVNFMKEEVMELLGDDKNPPKDTARAIAMMQALTKSGKGLMALREVQLAKFGRTNTQTIDPNSLHGQGREIWEQVQAKADGARAGDLFVPSWAAYDGVAVDAFTAMNYSTKKDYFRFAEEVDTPGIWNEAVGNLYDAMSNPQASKRLNFDDYQQMWQFMERNPDALKKLAETGKDARKGYRGIDMVKKLYEKGLEAGVKSKYKYKPEDETTLIASQPERAEDRLGPDGKLIPRVKAGEKESDTDFYERHAKKFEDLLATVPDAGAADDSDDVDEILNADDGS